MPITQSSKCLASTALWSVVEAAFWREETVSASSAIDLFWGVVHQKWCENAESKMWLLLCDTKSWYLKMLVYNFHVMSITWKKCTKHAKQQVWILSNDQWHERLKMSETAQTHIQKLSPHINHCQSHTDTWWDGLMDVDGNMWEISHSPFLQLSLSSALCFIPVDEQKPSTAYSSMSPACSLQVRFDSPTMHNSITHHHTSLFNTSLPTFSPPHHKVWLKISSADGGRDCLVVISAGSYTCFCFIFSALCYSYIVLKCRTVCEGECVGMWLSLSIYVCRSVWETKLCVSVWEEGNVLPMYSKTLFLCILRPWDFWK